MLSAKMKDQTQWYQTYVHPSRDTTLKLIQKAEKGGVRVVCITVDAPVLGKRERDLRMQFVDRGAHVHEAVDHSQGVSRALSAYIDASLTWNDLPWFIKNTSMQIVLKGIQCAEDALIAVKMGVKGIIVSNHGGRQVDTARSSIECLIEVVHALEFNNLRQRAHVFVDGGIRRGSDIFKAIAIGADGVGIGRPFMYGMSAYGQEGYQLLHNFMIGDRC